jgi:hypothetical protein
VMAGFGRLFATKCQKMALDSCVRVEIAHD